MGDLIRYLVLVVGFGALVVTSGGCTDRQSEDPIILEKPKIEDLQLPEEGLVTVQHILIGFEGTVEGKFTTRTQEEARDLAEELLKKAEAGEDFDKMVEEHTMDSAPGVYKIADYGIDTHLLPSNIQPRDIMAPDFGDVAFSLDVGEVGIAYYDEVKSPFGFHIIKRLE